MKNIILLLSVFCFSVNIILSQLRTPPPLPLPPPCPNGGAESINFSNWTTYTGASVNPQTNSSFINVNDPTKFGIHANTGVSSNYPPLGSATPMIVAGNDYYGGFAIPNEGTYCFRIGNNVSSAHAEMMRYTFTVTNANKNFKFRYAVVLEDNGHATVEQPNLIMYMNRGASINPVTPADFVLFNSTVNTISADVENPFFNISTQNSSVVYKGWQCVAYDLSAYVGQVVSFCTRVRGCTPGGHFGYAYIDGLCVAMPAIAAYTLPQTQFCLEEPIIMNASTTAGEDRYFIEITDVATAISVSEWFIDQPAPAAFDLKQFYQSKGKTFECGKSYRVKLAVASECAPWNETTKIINIVCPTVNAGNDVTLCCAGEGTSGGITLGSNAEQGYSYSWSSIPTGNVPNSSNGSYLSILTNSITQSVAYTVTKTNAKGCIAKDVVLVRVKPRYSIQIIKLPYGDCDNTTRVQAKLIPFACSESAAFLAQYPQNDASTTKWYWKPYNSATKVYLGTGSLWDAPNTIDGTIYAEYQDNCSSNLASASMPVSYNPITHNHGLIAPNAFTPDDGTYNNIFRILEYGPTAPVNIGDGPAYDATDFKLRIWDRWGTNFVTIDKSTIGRTGPLMQGDIQWDGKLNGVVQDGVYNYTLEMKYCGSSNFVQVQTPNGAEVDMCVRWFWAFCVQRITGWSSRVTVLQ